MKLIQHHDLTELSARAARHARLRMNWNLHLELSDPVQRFLNAMEPGTYVRPHRHALPEPRWELFVVLHGAVAVLILNQQGRVMQRLELNAAGGNRIVEIPPGAWHALCSLQSGTVLFECKPGPYSAIDDKDFAAWAPAESDERASALERGYRNAQVGDELSRCF